MGSAFHQLCPRYSGTLTPTAPKAIKLWETFTITFCMFSFRSSIRPIVRPSTRLVVGPSVCMQFFKSDACMYVRDIPYF